MFIPPYACWLTRMFTLALLILGSLMHRLVLVLHIWIMDNTARVFGSSIDRWIKAASTYRLVAW